MNLKKRLYPIIIVVLLIGSVGLVGGCDGQSNNVFTPEIVTPVDSALVTLRPECLDEQALGLVATRQTSSPYLIAAPHGTFDAHTADIAETVCASLDWNCVTARGYVVNGVRINVNRPTEGANLSSANEIRSERAACVYEYFHHAAQQLLNEAQTTLYVEIHGASSIQDIEIATIGLSQDQVSLMKATLQSAWNAQNGSSRRIKMEPLDVISLTASANKAIGMMSRYQPAIHIELPFGMRQDERTLVAQFLTNGLFTITHNAFN